VIPIIGAYVCSIVCNKAMNMADWCVKNKTLGAHGYFREHGWLVLKTTILHVPLFALWYSGALLPIVNEALALARIGALETVTPMSTLGAGWILDSIGTRIARYIKAPQKANGNGGAV
jgi:hypothetical protein